MERAVSDFWIIRNSNYRNVEAELLDQRMAKTLHSDRHRRLAELLTEKRKQAGLTQSAVAKALRRHQPFIANIENGDRRLDLVEFLDLAKVIGFDPYDVMRQIEAIESKTP